MDSVRILVVDDDPDIHALLKSSVKEMGWQIDAAYDGLDGLAHLEKAGAYDLVLTDICMPRLDGLELLERIQRCSPSIPVVVMTAQNTPDRIVRAIRDKAFTYFSKPFSPDAVVRMISHALEAPGAGDDVEVLSARPNWIALLLRCKIEIADRLLPFFRELQVDLPVDEQNNVAIAFRELLINAIEHGGHLDPEQRVEVAYIRLSQAILYYVRDPGEGFSFENLGHAAVASSPDDPFHHLEVRREAGMRAGGFGILIMHNIADELIYNEKGNQVLLVKYLPGGVSRK
jgi:CheY-like chemotaxis protein/anti-sigma regulatory factor (Ser/Thr protein kinase)